MNFCIGMRVQRTGKHLDTDEAIYGRYGTVTGRSAFSGAVLVDFDGDEGPPARGYPLPADDWLTPGDLPPEKRPVRTDWQCGWTVRLLATGKTGVLAAVAHDGSRLTARMPDSSLVCRYNANERDHIAQYFDVVPPVEPSGPHLLPPPLPSVYEMARDMGAVMGGSDLAVGALTAATDGTASWPCPCCGDVPFPVPCGSGTAHPCKLRRCGDPPHGHAGLAPVCADCGHRATDPAPRGRSGKDPYLCVCSGVCGCYDATLHGKVAPGPAADTGARWRCPCCGGPTVEVPRPGKSSAHACTTLRCSPDSERYNEPYPSAWWTPAGATYPELAAEAARRCMIHGCLVTHGLEPSTAVAAGVEAVLSTSCPRCHAATQESPEGPYCPACRCLARYLRPAANHKHRWLVEGDTARCVVDECKATRAAKRAADGIGAATAATVTCRYGCAVSARGDGLVVRHGEKRDLGYSPVPNGGSAHFVDHNLDLRAGTHACPRCNAVYALAGDGVD